MPLPLHNIRVLDLSRYLPGPFCTQMLADFGAEVIKVEDPRGGDLGRSLAPLAGNQSTRFYTVNRNKKSVALDLRQPAGKEIFRRLAATADVLIDQFRPGVMDRLGLGWAELQSANPRLIYCALTGYGLTGPLREAAGHDQNYLSIAGVTALTGGRGGAPVMSAVQIADIAGGALHAVIGILLALASRQQTGRGQLVDIAMTDASFSLLAYTIGEWAKQTQLPEPGNEGLTGKYACYNVYETKDRQYVTLGAIEGKFWRDFCLKAGCPEYIPEQWRPDRQETMKAWLQNYFQGKTRDEWTAFFAESDICFTPVLTLDEVCRHPQLLAREMVHTLTNVNDSGQDIVLTGIPIKLSETPGHLHLAFPELGEHSREVLLSLGYGEEEIEALRQGGVI